MSPDPSNKKTSQDFRTTSPRTKYQKLDEELTLQNQLYIDRELQEQEVSFFLKKKKF